MWNLKKIDGIQESMSSLCYVNAGLVYLMGASMKVLVRMANSRQPKPGIAATGSAKTGRPTNESAG
jgi:hypothetical protein